MSFVPESPHLDDYVQVSSIFYILVPHCFIVVEQYGCSCEHGRSFLLCLNLGIEIGRAIALRNFQVVSKSYSTTEISISSVYEC